MRLCRSVDLLCELFHVHWFCFGCCLTFLDLFFCSFHSSCLQLICHLAAFLMPVVLQLPGVVACGVPGTHHTAFEWFAARCMRTVPFFLYVVIRL